MKKETAHIASTVFKESLLVEMEKELERILNFWSTKAVDEKNGGFIGQINSFGNINQQASKGAVLNARILWTFSAVYRHCGNKNYLSLATRAYNYLIQYFWDKKNGGLIWEVDCKGNPTNTRKQAYAQGFGIYAFSEYYRAGGKQDSLQYAQTLYMILEKKFKDNKYGGYVEALKCDWTPLTDMRLSPRDYNSPKSMNTHLHILEPYTNLYRVWPDKQLQNDISELIDIFLQKIIDVSSGHFNLFFDMDWSVESSIVSFGHDIEGAWLLHEAAVETRSLQPIETIQKAATMLVDSTIKDGFCDDGSVFYEKNGQLMDTDRHWWVQAEAMIGLMDAREITKDNHYLEKVVGVWRFIQQHIVDRKNGEWFWSVDSNNNPDLNEDKVGFWKCPYHNCRALTELIKRLQKQFLKEKG